MFLHRQNKSAFHTRSGYKRYISIILKKYLLDTCLQQAEINQMLATDEPA